MTNNYNSLNPFHLERMKLISRKKIAMLLFFVFFGVLNSQAQIAVTVDNPTNTTPNLSASYTSLALALTDLNAVSGMTGPVTLTLAAGSETAPATGLTIGSATLNPVLSATNNVKLIASGSVVLNAGVGTATPASAVPDGILKIVGADWITLDGITFTDSNVANPATMEFGLALFKLSLADGASNNTIQNCIFNMQRINNANSSAPMVEGAVGILSINSTASAATTALVPTTAAGSNSNNKFYTNTINGGNIGIALIGYAAATPFTAADTNNDVGGASLATGNTILNYGGGAAATNAAAGIRTLAQYGINVSYNTVNNNDGSGVNHTTTLRGIYLNTAASASATVSNNTVTVKSAATTSVLTAIENASGGTAAANTININNNNIINCSYTTATTGTFSGVINSATAATVNVNGNTINNNTIGTSGSANLSVFQGIYNSANSVTQAFSASSNTITNNSVLSSFGTFYGIRASTEAVTCNLNTISNVSFPNGAGATAIVAYGIYDLSSPTTENYTNNTISNFTVSGSNTSTGSIMYGIHSNTVSGSNIVVSGNAISGFAYSNSSTGSAALRGVSLTTATTMNIFKNKIYDLSAEGAASVVSGITILGVTTANTYNNVIGNLTTPTANASNPLFGINVTGGTTFNGYYNTVYLNGASAGALFGSSAISVATGTTVDLRNNIFVNNSTVAGAGLAVAYRRSSTTLTSYAAASNNNLFYASNIFTDGTNTDATLAAFKTRVGSRDSSSISENPNFVSILGSNINFLHINTAIGTLIEGGGAPIATFTDDFDGDVRNVSTPDVGADEFAGTSLPVVVINNVAINPIGNQCTAVSRTVTANITAGSNAITSVTLNYSFDGVAQAPIAMTGGTLTAGTTSTFTAVIPVAVPVNANVTWSVSAVDPLTSKTTTGTSYQDEPLFGFISSATASVSTTCNGGSTILSATLLKNGAGSSIGTATSLTGLTEELTAFCNRRVSYRYQIVYTAAELAASGLAAGPINAMSFNISANGDSASNTLFTVKMGTSASATFTDYISNAGFTTVFPSANYTHAVGLNVINFSTPYAWDGVSNVVVEVTHNGIDSINNAQTYYTTTAGNTIVYGYNGAVAGTPSNRRFNVIFSGNVAAPISNYSWSDGSTVVGTGNNLSVSPTVNTTYTATLTSSGCTIATNAVAVTVNTTAAPTGAANQTFTTGQTLADIVVTGTSIIWYASASDAATATNALPSSTVLVDDAIYYATQTVSGCASTTSLAVTVDVPLGMNTFDSNGFRAHPNPVNNTLNIEYTSDLTAVSVYNMLGQQVLTKKVTASSTQVDMSGLNAGTYLVKVEANNVSKILKVVKQ